ncbi:zinc knuckle CX2CX4HX4C containing protein [Tanacetum coccineum]
MRLKDEQTVESSKKARQSVLNMDRWFSDNERQETDESRIAEALAALEATLEIKKHHAEEGLVHETMESLKKMKINRPLLKEIWQTENYVKPMKDLVANKPKTKEDEEIRMNPRRLDFNNALADLRASINIMPLSMNKRLGMGKLEPINMVIEMADNTKCTPKGIIENLLVKINKFIFLVDFVILDMVKDFRMAIILGRPFLATTHAKVDIFRKSISLEVGNEKVIFKMRSIFTTTIFEFVRAIRSETCPEDDDFKKIDHEIFLYEFESCELNRLLGIDPNIFSYDIDIQESYEEIVYRMTEVVKKTHLKPKEKRVHWCEGILQEKENVHQYWASCDPYSDVCDGGGLPNNKEKRYWASINDSERDNLEWEELSLNDWMKIRYGKVFKMNRERILKDHWRERFGDEEDDIEENLEDLEEYREDKANAIMEAIHDKLNDDWFKDTREDKDDLEGIIDYLEPKSYDEFINPDNEAYNERKCRLLGMVYRKPSPILIEKAEVTRYKVGPGETYTKVKVLEIDEMPKPRDNVAAIRAELMDEIRADRNTKGKT